MKTDIIRLSSAFTFVKNYVVCKRFIAPRKS
jgi:hypothetical protein